MNHHEKKQHHKSAVTGPLSPRNGQHSQQQQITGSNSSSSYNSNRNTAYNYNKKYCPAVPSSIPHHGSLCRVVDDNDDFLEPSYIIEIDIQGDLNKINDKDGGENSDERYHELVFNRHDYEFALRVFAILDSESTSFVDKSTVRDFVYRRCPVFWRRDEDLYQLGVNYNDKSQSRTCTSSERNTNSVNNNETKVKRNKVTFDEIWHSVIACGSRRRAKGEDFAVGLNMSNDARYLGLEGWMVFFRFIALAQYLEAKRRFSARHLQQTMRHRNSPRGSEMVVVNVPPAEPPVPLTPLHLARYERSNQAPLPAPELDLDHSLLAAHDCHNLNIYTSKDQFQNGHVKISLFGSSSSSATGNVPSTNANSNNLEFAVVYSCLHDVSESLSSSTSPAYSETVVRRSMADMKWLEETFTSHKILGGTLCGRILPPFPGSTSFSSTITNKVLSSHFHNRGEDSSSSIIPSKQSIKQTTGSAINVAYASVDSIRNAAKSFVGSYLGSTATSVLFKKDESLSNNTASPSLTSNTQYTQQQKVSASFQKQQFRSQKKKSLSLSLPESYYNPNSPTGKARQLERYLNYLLEHPALSTSFPLNTILKVIHFVFL